MNSTWLLLDALRGVVLLTVALTAHAMVRRKAARLRQVVLAAALVSVGVAPILARALTFSRAIPVVGAVAFSVRPFVEPEGAEIAAPEVLTNAPVGSGTWSSHANPSPSSSRMRPAIGLVATWALGAALILVRLANGIFGARRLVRNAHWEIIPPFTEVIARTVEETGVVAQVAISDDVRAPLVTGIRRPVVLMPRSSVAWTSSRWRAVLLHELTHVKRRDCLMSVLSQIVCALHWFDPLVWLARSQWRKECELVADEAVIAAGIQPSDYAEHLLGIAVGIDAEGAVAGALAMASRTSDLVRRVETIIGDVPSAAFSARTIFGVLSVATALTCTVACAGARNLSAPVASSSAGNTPPDDKSSISSLGVRACEQPDVEGTNLAALIAQRTHSPVDRNELTIDPRLQLVADEEVARVVAAFHARRATAIILDPAKGEILAVANPDTARQAFITGSTMKSLTVAAALDAKLVRVGQTFDCRPRPNEIPFIQDPTPRESLDLAEIVAVSSNVGALRVYQALGEEGFERALGKFHLGDEKSPVQLCFRPFAPLSPLDVQRPRFVATNEEAAIGEGFVTTPLQMIAAYSVFANGGEYVAPTLVRSMRDEHGTVVWRHAPVREPILRAETAQVVMGMLELAVDGPRSTGKAARLPGVRVAGKTGTSSLDEPSATQVYASFIGIVPADAPRYVILVGVVDPREGGAPTVAAPAFARIAARALAL